MARYRIRNTADGPVVRLNRNAYVGSVTLILGAAWLAAHAYDTAGTLGRSSLWAWAAVAAVVAALHPWAQDLRWALGRMPRLLLGGDEIVFDRTEGVVTKNDLVQCKLADIRKIAIIAHSRVPHVERRYAGASYLVGLLTPDGSFTMVDDTWDETSAWQLQEQLCVALRIPAVFVDLETEGIPVEPVQSAPAC